VSQEVIEVIVPIARKMDGVTNDVDHLETVAECIKQWFADRKNLVRNNVMGNVLFLNEIDNLVTVVLEEPSKVGKCAPSSVFCP
jgi:hypothetical protein